MILLHFCTEREVADGLSYTAYRWQARLPDIINEADVVVAFCGTCEVGWMGFGWRTSIMNGWMHKALFLTGHVHSYCIKIGRMNAHQHASTRINAWYGVQQGIFIYYEVHRYF